MTYTPITQGTLNWDVPVNAAFVDQNGRIDTNTANIATHTSQIAALQPTDFQPVDHGLIAWTAEPGTMFGASTAITAGQIYFSKLKVPAAATISNITYGVNAVGVGTTAGQCFVGLYDAAGNRLGVSADQATNFTVLGTKVAPITPVNVGAGFYYVAFLSNSSGASPQVIGTGGAANLSMVNVNLSMSVARSITTAAGNTSLPTSISFAAQSVNSVLRWGALS